jgi:hypothetical protein
MQEPAAKTAEAAAATPSPGSSLQSPLSSGSSSSHGGLGEKSAAALCWATFGVIAFAWLCTSKLDSAPWWGPTGSLVINAMPGGMVTEILKSVGIALIDKLPGRGSAGK